MAGVVERLLLLMEAQGGQAVSEIGRVAGAARGADTSYSKLKGNLVSGLAAGAGYAGIQGAANAIQRLGQFSLDAAAAAAEDARGQIILATSLKNATDASDAQVASVEEYINVAQRATAVSDTDLRQAFGTLARSTGDVARAQTLMNIAQDVAAGTGRNVTVVAEALAKAWEGQTTALTRLVPETAGLVREGASANEVFAVLRDRFQGIATEAGAVDVMARMRIESDEFKEQVGEGLVPALQNLNDTLAVLNATPVPKILTMMSTFNPVTGFAATFGQGTKSIKEMAKEADAAEQGSLLELYNRFNQLAQGSGRVAEFLTALGYGARRAAGEMGATATSAEVLSNTLDRLRSMTFDVSDAAHESADAWADVDEAATATSGSAKDMTSAYRAVESAARQVTDAEEALADAHEEVADAQGKVAEAERDLAVIRHQVTPRTAREAELDLADARDAVESSALRVREAEKKLVKAQEEGDPDEIADATLDLAAARREAERATFRFTDAMSEYNKAIGFGEEGAKKVADAEKELEDQRDLLDDATKRAADAQRDLADAHRAVGDAEAALTKGGGGGPVADRAHKVADAFDNAIKKDLDWIQTLVEQGASEAVIQAAIETSKLRVQEYADKYGATGGLNEQLATYLDLLRRIRDETTEVDWVIGPGGNYYPVPKNAPSRDGGGPGVAGQSYQIGTKEYFRPSVSGDFVPLHGAPSAPSGGSPINVTLMIDKMKLAEVLINPLMHGHP